MLGVLFFERDPLQLADVPGLFVGWLVAIGPFALIGMFLLVGVTLRYGRWSAGTLGGDKLLLPEPWMHTVVRISLFVCLLATIARFGFAMQHRAVLNLTGLSGSKPLETYYYLSVGSGILAGVAGLVGVGAPFLSGCFALRWRRIWALTVLSFKEGVRRRVLYVFAALLIVLMFASWFVGGKPEHQVRTYVAVIDLAMTPLLLFAGVLVAAFSIPTDIRQQTIHTILTKPVERFELVLGRFFGYVGLMTVILLGLNLVGVLYVIRGVDPEAAAESLKARDPWYGVLTFEEGNKPKERGESVGREWDYRSYITRPWPEVEFPPTAVWTFTEPPARLAARDKVRCEFAFDIYRTTKGNENKGVGCEFIFTTWKFKRGQEVEARALKGQLTKEGKSEAEADAEVASRFGYFEIPGKGIADFHTLSVDVPGALFRNAIPTAAERSEMAKAAQAGVGPVTLRVRCLSYTQYVGVARYDLYLRQDEAESSADRLWFALNFFKGAFGLWLRLCLVIGLAVCLSTYLSGVVSLLIALLLYVGGMFREFIEQVALGLNIGGGPLESLLRLTTRSTMNAPLEDTVIKNVSVGADYGFRALARFVLNMIPEIDRFDLTPYVAEGFDLPIMQLFVSFLLLAGYLLPWFVLAYFMMKGREIASGS